MPNDDFPLDQFQRIAMTLSEILANRPQNRALARASDVPGADLQWMYTAAYPTGAWYGDLGELGTNAFRDSLFAGYLAIGVTCKVSGTQYTYGAAGWVVKGVSVLASVRDRYDQTVVAGTVGYPVLFANTEWKIPANTLGPNGKFSLVRFEGYFNINHVGSSVSTQTSFRMFNNVVPGAGNFFIGESLAQASPSGLTSRYGKIECDLVWNAGGINPTIGPGIQVITKTYGLFSMNGFDAFRDLDTFETASPKFDPEIDNILYPGFRIQNAYSDVIIGSRAANMIAIGI